MFENLEILDSIRLNFSPTGLFIMNLAMAFIAAWWGIWHIISGLILAGFWSHKPVTQVT